jgi:hypothetical protein
MIYGDTDTLLVRAARYGREESIRLLLECQADVNQTNGYGDSPAFAACLASQIGAVRILHEAGADLSFIHDMSGLTLLDAALRDFEEPIREVEWMQLRAKDMRSQKLVTMQAKHTAQLAVVRYLLEVAKIAPVVMALCADSCKYHPIVSLLSDQPNGMGRSAPRREQLRLLLTHGFTPDMQYECPSYLCPWVKTPPQCSLLHMACFNARHCDSQFNDEYVMVRLLVEGKGDPSILSSQQESPLSFALRKNLMWMVKILQASSTFALPHCSGFKLLKAGPYIELAQDIVVRSPTIPSPRPATQSLEALWSIQDWEAYKATCSLSGDMFDEYCRRRKIAPFEQWRDEVHGNIGPPGLVQSEMQPVAQATMQVQAEAVAPSGVPQASPRAMYGAMLPPPARCKSIEPATPSGPSPDADLTAAGSSAIHAAGPRAPEPHTRRDTPMLTRAERAGVIDMLKPLPDSPAHGSDAAATKQHQLEKRIVQKANERRVARAEKRLRKMLRP